MTMFKLDESIFSQRINDLKSTSDDFAKAKVAFGNLDISEMWTALSEVNKFSVPLGATMKVIDGELTNISQQYTEVIANLRIALEKSLGADDTHQGKYVHLLDTLAQASANFAYKTPEFLSRLKEAVHLGQSLVGGEGSGDAQGSGSSQNSASGQGSTSAGSSTSGGNSMPAGFSMSGEFTTSGGGFSMSGEVSLSGEGSLSADGGATLSSDGASQESGDAGRKKG